MKVKCLIVDDEPLAIKLLQNHVEQIDSLEVVGYCHNAVKASALLRTTPVDLMFLDIKMPQLTGIDFLRTCRYLPAVIFTTAYREYALEGYELDVVDYLLKPITFDRFFKAIERYYQRTAPREESVRVVADRQDPYIHLRAGNKFHRLAADEVLYIESIRDYIVVHRAGKEKLSVKYKISDLEEELKDRGFLRIHRSFIIHIDKVTAYSAQEVELGNIQLPVGNNYRDYTLKMLKAP